MTNALQIINRAAELIGYKDPEEALSGGDTANFLGVLNDLVDGWNTQRLFIVNVAEVVASVSGTSATVGDGMTFATARPVRLEDGGFSRLNGVDYPLSAIDRVTYEQIALKTVQGTFPQYAYYDATLPTGTVYFYPAPATAISVHLPFQVQLSAFADQATDYNLAPGYKRALELSLAEELAPGRRQLDPFIARQAQNARRAIRRSNVDVPLLDVMPTNARFNIYSGL